MFHLNPFNQFNGPGHRCFFHEVIEVLMGRHFFVKPPNCYATFTYGGQEYTTDTHHNATNPPLVGFRQGHSGFSLRHFETMKWWMIWCNFWELCSYCDLGARIKRSTWYNGWHFRKRACFLSRETYQSPSEKKLHRSVFCEILWHQKCFFPTSDVKVVDPTDAKQVFLKVQDGLPKNCRYKRVAITPEKLGYKVGIWPLYAFKAIVIYPHCIAVDVCFPGRLLVSLVILAAALKSASNVWGVAEIHVASQGPCPHKSQFQESVVIELLARDENGPKFT